MCTNKILALAIAMAFAMPVYSADFCVDQGYPRIVHLPPSSIAAGVNFRTLDEKNGQGRAKGVAMTALVTLTNVGTITQEVYVEVNDIQAGVLISGIPPVGSNYRPPGLSDCNDPRPQTACLHKALDATSLATMKRTVTIPAGETVKVRIGAACTMASGMPCYNIPSTEVLGYAPTYGAFNPPKQFQANVGFGGRVCVRGPQGKRPLGALIGTVTYDAVLYATPEADNYTDDDSNFSRQSFPIMSGLGF